MPKERAVSSAKPMRAWMKWGIAVGCIAAFLWLDANPRTAMPMYRILGWAMRVGVAFAAWVLSDRAFEESRAPRRTAFRALGVIAAITVFGALNAGCTTAPNCDEDPIVASCGSICDVVSTAARVHAGGVLLVILGFPTLLAAFKHRERLLSDRLPREHPR
jgi:hypothetical protein